MSPVHFVAKKDGTWRMVQDYWHINQWTIKNGYPLPLIADILDGVGKRKVFTKLDLRWRYNNVRIKEEDEWKAVVVRTLSRKRFPQHSNIQPKNLQVHNKVERHNKGINKLSHVTRSGDHKNILEETCDHGTLGYSYCSNSISRAAIQ